MLIFKNHLQPILYARGHCGSRLVFYLFYILFEFSSSWIVVVIYFLNFSFMVRVSLNKVTAIKYSVVDGLLITCQFTAASQ